MDNTLKQILWSLFQVTQQNDDLTRQLTEAKQVIESQRALIARLEEPQKP